MSDVTKPSRRFAAKATSFATRQDLAAFAICVTSGGSVQHCLSVGDNGIGAWNQATWKPYGEPICALPRGVARKDAKVRVRLNGRELVCICRDISPPGIVDLNPSALIKLGYAPDMNISEPCEWEFVE